MKRLAALLALILALAPARALRAQASSDLLARGIRAVQNLDYDSAAIMLRAALARVGTDPLPDTARARALMFLGATEYFREHRDSAVAVFGRLLALDPRYRPDQLVFPPEISSLFQDVRAGTRAVAVTLPPSVELAGPGDRLAMRLYATSLHDIAAVIARPGARGVTVRRLYAGSIGDSLELLWDGRDSSGTVVDSGAYVLRVSSRATAPRADRVIEIPLEVRPVRRDTLPWPAPMNDSLLLPENTTSGHPSRSLAGGILAGVAVAVLPSVIASGHSATGARFGVAAATSIAGIVGFVRGRHAEPIAANIASNRALRAAWQQRLDTVREENANRVRATRLAIRSGTTRVVSP